MVVIICRRKRFGEREGSLLSCDSCECSLISEPRMELVSLVLQGRAIPGRSRTSLSLLFTVGAESLASSSSYHYLALVKCFQTGALWIFSTATWHLIQLSLKRSQWESFYQLECNKAGLLLYRLSEQEAGVWGVPFPTATSGKARKDVGYRTSGTWDSNAVWSVHCLQLQFKTGKPVKICNSRKFYGNRCF